MYNGAGRHSRVRRVTITFREPTESMRRSPPKRGLRNAFRGGDANGLFRNVPAMAFRTSARLTLATLGVGALAGASQLGVAYGLGIIRLTRVFDVTTRDQWTTQLAWVAWIAMTSVVIGGLVATAARGDAPSRRTAPPPRTGPAPTSSSVAIARAGALADRTWRNDGPRLGVGAAIPLALASGLGALIVVPLTMQPARTAQIAGVHPALVVGLTAGLGALVGVFAAIAAMMQPVARWSLTTVGLIMWAVAIISVAPTLGPSDPLPEIRLGVFDAGFLSHPVGQRIALLTMPLVAVLVGLMLGAVARRQERATLTIALAGLPGPALLTVAYLIAGPGTGSERYQVVPYWAAMTATGAGVLGSVLAVILRRTPGPEEGGDATAEQPPLPRREQQESAIAKAAADPTGAAPSPGGSSGGLPGGGGIYGTAGGTAAGSDGSDADPGPKVRGLRLPGQRRRAGRDRPTEPSAALGSPRKSRGTAAPWSPAGGGFGHPTTPAPATSTLLGDETETRPLTGDGDPRPSGRASGPRPVGGVFRGFSSSRPRRTSPDPTPLTTPPVAPPPVAPPPVAPPPISPPMPEAMGEATSRSEAKPETPGRAAGRRRSARQRTDEDHVDWVSGLGG